MSVFLPLLTSGIALGSVYAAIALGFVLVFKSSGILNFAQGDFVMIAIYLAILCFVTLRLPAVIAILFVFAAMGALGLLVHYLVAKPLIGKPFFSLVLATIGVGLILHAVVIGFFGVYEQRPLALFTPGVFHIGDAAISYSDVTIVIITFAVVGAFAAIFRWSSIGLRMRAVAENLEAAVIVGIDTDRVFAITWIVGLIVSAIGGILYANFTSSIDLSISDIGLAAIPAAIIGGMTSIPGAVIGGLLLGLIEQIASGYLGAQWRDLFSFGSLFIVLMIRPQGLFGRAEIVRV